MPYHTLPYHTTSHHKIQNTTPPHTWDTIQSNTWHHVTAVYHAIPHYIHHTIRYVPCMIPYGAKKYHTRYQSNVWQDGVPYMHFTGYQTTLTASSIPYDTIQCTTPHHTTHKKNIRLDGTTLFDLCASISRLWTGDETSRRPRRKIQAQRDIFHDNANRVFLRPVYYNTGNCTFLLLILLLHCWRVINSINSIITLVK